MGFSFTFHVIFLFGAIFLHSTADPVDNTQSSLASMIDDKQALLDFVNNIHHSRALNWKENSSVCDNWTGVICNHAKSRIIAVRLPGVGFRGPIPPNTLSRLSDLQTLSLRSNSISGSFPSDFLNLANLTSLYLNFNNFSGRLPLDFSVWKNLTILNLSNNAFNGSIPISLSNLTHLTTLILANNSLSGLVPDLNLPNLQVLDLAYNNLTGPLPQSLLRFPSTAFVGNHISYYESMSPSPLPELPSSHESKKWWKFSESALLGIILGGCVLGFVIIAIMIICCSKREGESGFLMKSTKSENSMKKDLSGIQNEIKNKLVFFEGCNLAFDLEDLLRASAEVLGKGTYAMTYRASLEDANTVVVKRLKEGSVTKRDFEQHMEIVGSIKHENVAALRAYYYSKEEKLMMFDYFSQGSVSALIHENRNESRTPLDWETRLKIAIGAARGLAQIHTHNKLVHGNIKSSNIFINSQGYGCIADLGLATLLRPLPPGITRSAGYRAPEITDTRKSSQPSDVYSFGVFLLELLTGKSPTHTATGGGGQVIHLVRWVNSVVREEWTAEVFDLELLTIPNIEEELVAMLQIGLSCAVKLPERRPEMAEVVKKLEEIRRDGTGNQPSFETTPEHASEEGSSSITK